MARKVFISFLGTNNYVECIYDINGHQSKPVKYVKEKAIAEEIERLKSVKIGRTVIRFSFSAPKMLPKKIG